MIIYDADITGSLKVNGSDFNLTSISSSIVTNSSSIASLELVSGSYANSASFASDISTNSASIASLEKVSGSYANSASFASSISANSSSIGSLNSVSGSYANSASFASNISTNSASIGSLNAVSSSYLLNTTDTLTGDLTVTGNIIATTLNVQDVTASVVYSSGSNIFGSSSIDTQQFTGSILTSGSIEVNGDKFTVSGATGNTVVGGTLNSGAITSTGAGTFAGDVEIRSGNKLILQRPNNGVATEISTDSTGAMILNSINDEGFFFNNAGTNAFKLDPTDATFAGMIMVNGDGIDIDNNDNLRLRFDNASVFKAGLQVATSTGDMITSSTTDDFAIRSQSNILFATGGSTEKMRISSDGNVTIGSSTLTGSRSLTLLSATNATDYDINFQQEGTTNFGRIRFTEGASDFQFFAQVGQDPNLTLQYGGNSFFSRGNVGIGITTPQTTLQVNGTASSFNAHFGQGANAGSGVFGGISLGYSEATNSYYRKVGIVAKSIGDGAARQELHFLVDSVSDQNSAGIADSKMMIDINGNVGIGTGSPDQVGYGYKVLTIMGGATAGYAGVLELLTPTTDTNGQNLGIISFGSGGTRNAMIGAVRQSGNNNGKLEFWTSAGASGIQRRMTIDADGQVGIGTDQPRTKFEIFRPAGQSSTPQLTLGTGENSSVDYSLATDTVSAGDFCILSGVSNTSSAIKMRFQGNDVFFGTPTSTYPSTNNFVHINTQSGVSMIIGGHSGTHTAVQFRHNGSTVCGAIVITSTSTSYNSGSSDKRLKKNITNWNENILDKFKDLQPKEFHFNNQDNTEKKQKGYIAQNEVDKFPEAYPLVEDEESGEKRYQFNPSGMNIYLMKAIQELEARIKILENK